MKFVILFTWRINNKKVDEVYAKITQYSVHMIEHNCMLKPQSRKSYLKH